jgi:hypothetical protein
MVDGIDETLEALNSTNELAAFVCEMRKKFKRTVTVLC